MLINRKPWKTGSEVGRCKKLARVTVVILTILVLAAEAPGCEYSTTKSALQTSVVHEALISRLDKLEQSKFVPPCPAAPLITDPRSLPYETERIGRESSEE